ncbi:tetratricopeptide repeat protein [Prosthecomicrobium sp. N25]|uniref:tetratricopeptide repeat protein n=1 Tax=Prosthecomicrobium sp. N25 TaxID=3129254 RepID=UPI003076A17B
MSGERKVAAAVRDYIARQHISRDEFAFRTRLGRSTVDKLLTGLFSERTLAIVEGHTGLALRGLLEAGPEPDPVPAEPAAPVRPPDRPSIAVLPFAYFGPDPEQAFMADGLTEDIITGLARLRWLFVIARNSTFVYRGRPVDVRAVARDLGVRYVLEGSVRTAGGRLRVTGQLVDAETGKHIWAERYDGDPGDIFTVLDDITEKVVAAVEPHLTAEEGFRAAARQTDSIDAWGLAVRAIDLINRVEREANREAQALLERAIAIEPSYARPQALLSWATWWSAVCYWDEDRPAALARASERATAALALDANDPWARMVAGLCHSTLGRHDRALGETAAALALNPSFALGHSVHGLVLLRAGQAEAAIAETGRALRLSPLDSLAGLYTSNHGLALLGARRFDEALPFLRRAVASYPAYPGHYNALISCCGHLGLVDEARDFIAIRNRVGPPLVVRTLVANLAAYAHGPTFVEGLRKAGVPEG